MPSVLLRILATIVCALALWPSLAAAEKRVALVIGNSSYENALPLKNPVNDANDISAKLKKLGFDVIVGTDLDQTEMRRAVKEFSYMLEGADTAMFFYAGHAVQVGKTNYLAPIDTDLKQERDLDFETISLDFVHRQMERSAKTNLLFLDACRNNPLTRQLVRASRSQGSGGQGLARLDTSGEGTLIVYATQPDNVALDGDGRNSPFTSALLNHIERPNIEISSLMTDVRREVYEATDEKQLPWTNSSLLGQFFFNPQEVKPVEPVKTEEELERERKLEALAREADDWETVSELNSIDGIKAFLQQYPDGNYTELAKFTLERLEGEKNGTQETATATQPAKTEEVVTEPVETAKKESTTTEEVVTEPAETAKEEPAKTEDESVEVASLDTTEPEKPTRELVRSMQTELNRLGCDAGRPDGIWGRNSRGALTNFARHAEIDLASLEPETDLLDTLKEREGRVCPLVCSARQEEQNGRCVTKSCPAGQQLSSKGTCFTPATAQRNNRTNTRRSTPRTKSTGGGSCFRFNGQLVCG